MCVCGLRGLSSHFNKSKVIQWGRGAMVRAHFTSPTNASVSAVWPWIIGGLTEPQPIWWICFWCALYNFSPPLHWEMNNFHFGFKTLSDVDDDDDARTKCYLKQTLNARKPLEWINGRANEWETSYAWTPIREIIISLVHQDHLSCSCMLYGLSYRYVTYCRQRMVARRGSKVTQSQKENCARGIRSAAGLHIINGPQTEMDGPNCDWDSHTLACVHRIPNGQKINKNA